MRGIAAELKEIRLQGMDSAWGEQKEQDGSTVAASKWLFEHLLQAEHTDRAMRSVSHQMFAANFLLHRDLAGFDVTSPKVYQPLCMTLPGGAHTPADERLPMCDTWLNVPRFFSHDINPHDYFSARCSPSAGTQRCCWRIRSRRECGRRCSPPACCGRTCMTLVGGGRASAAHRLEIFRIRTS